MKNLLLKLNERKSITLCLLLIIANIGYSQTVQTFTTPGLGSVVIPAGVTTVTVEVWGAGGGGGSSNNSDARGGSGGGGGAYARGIHAVTPGSTYFYTIGSGGNGGPAISTIAPTAGTVSWFNATAAAVTAPPNQFSGALANGGGAGVNNSNTTPNNGGTAFGNNIATSGATGVAGTNSGGGNGGNGANGGTGGSGSTSSNGGNGNPPGGGGGGSDDNASRTGGNGANGQVRITWTCPTYTLTAATSATGPFCGASTSNVTLRSNTMAAGTYIVTYNLSGATTATGLTASMNFTSGSPGTGTFSTPTLNVGTTNITITNLDSGTTCSNTVSSNNTASVIINASSSISLTSGVGTDNQTRCLGSAISTITYNTSGATGATFSGLPTGVTGNWAANTVTISGTSTVTGIFNYTVTLIGGCGLATANGTITIGLSNTISLTSGAPTTNQTLCINTPISSITYSTTNASGATFSGLPPGVTGTWAANVVTISGTPTASGVFNYTVTLTGGCSGSTTATGTITVSPLNTIAVGINRTVCINTAMTSITLATTSATGATVTGLPAGVTGTWATNQVSISGTPTVSGTFNYTVTTTGGCTPAISTGTITVTPLSTIASGVNRTTCINTAISNITLATTGATGTTVTGLPTGVTGNWAANQVTISGTPTVSGKFSYTVTTTGGCTSVITNGTITVNPNNTIALTSGVGTNNQTRCINTAISNITFATTGATGATFSGLPAGVTGNWAANVATVSGTPASSGVFNYTVTLTGGCGVVTATGTLTVTPNNTITLTSAAGTNNQTRCVNTAITTIRYTTTGATGAKFSGLPVGVTANWAANVVNITGTPTVAGTFNYTITLTGGCSVITANGAITVNPILTAGVSVTASPAGAICVGTSVTFTANPTNGGTTPTYQWQINGTNVPGQTASTFTTNTLANSNVVRVIMTSNATPCLAGSPVTSSGITMTVNTLPIITSTTPGSRTGVGTVLLGATVSTGTLNWYDASTGGTLLGTGTSFTTPIIAATTTFFVEAVNGACTTSPRIGVVATVNYSEVDVFGNGTGIANNDTSPSVADWTDFGTTNVTRTFTIRNTGSALLTVGTITISGANASEFTVTTPPSATVAIGASTTFTITFAPTAVGVRNATITFSNNDTDENPYSFSIQGTGVQQEIDIQGNGISIIDGDATPSIVDWTDFGTVAGTRTFTIRNLGNIALSIGTISITGANASDFTVTTLPSATVAGFGTTTFVITFNPSAINIRNASISIVNNDATENPYDFAVSGFGIIPEIDIQGNAISIVDGDTTPDVSDWTDFSTVTSTRTFTIFNNGNLTLTIGAITITGANASEFTITTPPASNVAAFSSTSFVVTFIPAAIGVRSAALSIVNNDSSENPYNFNIQGTGTPREIELVGNGLSISSGDMVTSINDHTDFGPADINLATVTRTFTIRNTGSLSLTIANPTITGANASEFSITANPGTLTIGANSSTTFQVTFNPSAVFTRLAQINIVNNDSDENPYTFAIQGTGLLDNDGDGIENNIDLDDDNDGILDTIECGTCTGEPFINGSFETPVIAPTSFSILPTANVNGWQTSAEPFIEIWSSGFNGVPAAEGNQFAELNANVPGTLYQTFCLNGAGGTINWAIKHRGRAGTDTAFVKFGDTLANAIASSPIVTMTDGNSAWGSYSGTYTIPVGQTSIVLTFQAGPTASGNPSIGNFIDDVQINISLNCIDTDVDGIQDIVDVDDDNDGIPDIEEAGFKLYSNGTATMDKTSAATWLDANANGLNDYIETMISGGTYLIPDTDGDGIPNHLDLDSDNDSLFDVDEANLLNGDGDINGDGRGDGLDAEGDGLLNLYDNSTAFGSATRPYAQDSDSNGIPDYLQLDSNDDGINDIQTGLYSSFDTNGDGRIDGTGDSDSDGILNVFDTNDVVKGSPRDLNRKLFLDFDGRNDYAEDAPILGGLPSATLMAWIDLNSGFNSAGYVVGQTNFYLRVTTARTLQAVVNGTPITFATPLNRAQWYHVAATYGGGSLNLFLNGRLVLSQAITGNINADASRLTLGKNPAAASNFFRGKIDEVRVFNIALTSEQVQRMVYQEIQNTGSQVRGAIVPKDIGGLPFANVLRYYRMDAYQDDILDDLTTPTIDTGTGMKSYNHKLIAVQQAPMPFTTVRTGSFATAVHDVSRDIRGMDVTDFDYSIIQVRHNITDTANNTDLGMFVDPGVTITMNNDTKIQNDWYLKLDGRIDLVGRSQLVQTTNSDLDVTSIGSIERDQQGQSNRFNYNYWSSPVSSINNSTINHGFTVAGVMKDGTTTTPQNITWTSGINGAATSPITLSSYWIFKFQNLNNNYANWASVGQNGTLLAGQGYTMKGAGVATANQNYTFVGKPNNGVITSPVSADNLNLCGNPYASAIDADQFIDDNATSIKGTLFFWEHYDTNNSHNTVEYQGGYATYTKVGGTPPVAPAGISGLGASSKTPKRFIPVGQGFFVTGTPTGGTITFNNSQRLFVKEDNTSSYTLFRNTNPTVATNSANNNANDTFATEEFMKLRLGYTSTNNYHRQILLGFMDDNAIPGFDEGYDGLSIETLTNDMYFMQGTNKLNIQGDGFFNANNIYPLGVKNATAGNVKFKIDSKENFSEDQEIYIYDNQNNQYHSIKSQDFEINLPAGVIENRFSLRFANATSLGTNDNEVQNEIGIIHSQSNNIITIKNELLSAEIKSVVLFNMIGQQIMTWDIENPSETTIELPVTNVSTGAYIVKVITDKGDASKKIMVK